jgi:hypothetical protein
MAVSNGKQTLILKISKRIYRLLKPDAARPRAFSWTAQKQQNISRYVNR